MLITKPPETILLFRDLDGSFYYFDSHDRNQVLSELFNGFVVVSHQSHTRTPRTPLTPRSVAWPWGMWCSSGRAEPSPRLW